MIPSPWHHFLRSLSSLIGGQPSRGRPFRKKASRRARLGVELLEDRLVPAAVRDLAGFTANTLPASDDGSTAAVAFGFDAYYDSTTYTSVYVNTNGNVTFDGALMFGIPFPLNSAEDGIIAPFFADVDTRGLGSGLVSYGQDTVDGRAAFGVNWVGVGYSSEHDDKLNSFQLVLIDRSDVAPGAFDIEFNYDQIEWEAGDVGGGSGGLGGTSARAGYFLELPGSGVNGAFLDSNPLTGLIHSSFNSSVLGRYRFAVRNPAGNQAPTAVDDSYSVDENDTLDVNIADGVLGSNDSDPDGDLLAALLVNDVEHGELLLRLDGSFVYTPEADWSGTDSFTYRATDGRGTSATATVTLTVAGVNTAPVLVTEIPDQSGTEDEPFSLIFAEETFADADVGDTLTYTAALVGGGTLPVWLSFDGPSRTFSGTPGNADVAVLSITVTATDAADATATDTFDLTVSNTNDAPVLDPIGNRTIEEGSTLTFTATASDPDVPANTLTFTLEGNVPEGASIDPNTGAFTWTPTEAQGPAEYTFTVRVTDNGDPNLLDEEEITVTVNEINDAPVLDPVGNWQMLEDQTLTFTATATDPDAGDSLTFSLIGAPADASIDPDAGIFTWTPTVEQGPGQYTFTIRVTDDGDPALYDEEQITVTVGAFGIISAPGPIRVQLGATLENELLATLTAYDPTEQTGDFVVSVSWGDGHTSSSASGGSEVIIVPFGEAPGAFALFGSHFYDQSGVYQPIITVTREGTTLATGDGPSIEVVGTQLSLTALGEELTALEGVEFSPMALASLTDATQTATVDSFEVTIDWGDGQVTPAIIEDNGDHSFTISGSHLYEDRGPYTATVRVIALTGDMAEVAIPVDVINNPLQTQGLSARAIKGELSEGLALVRFPESAGDPSGLTITINWGDDTSLDSTTPAVISDGNGNYLITGSHAYTEAVPYDVDVTITTLGGVVITVASFVEVVSAGLSVDGATFESTPGAVLDNVTVATFVSGNHAATPGDFIAWIDWGEGSGQEQGTVSGSTGVFTITGGHSFASVGRYDVTIAVSGPDGAAASATSVAYVVVAPFSTTGETILLPEGTPLVDEVIGTIHTTNLSASPSDFAVGFQWMDDAASSAGDVIADLRLEPVPNDPGMFYLVGSHAALQAGEYDYTITVTHGAQSRLARGVVVVGNPPSLLEADEFNPGAEGSPFQYFPLALAEIINQAPAGEQAQANTHQVAQGEPKWVNFSSPTSVAVPAEWQNTALRRAIDANGDLRLNLIDTSIIRELSPANLRILLGLVEGIGNANATVLLRGDNPINVTDNALAFLIAHIWGTGDSEAVARVFAAKPALAGRYLPLTAMQVLRRPVNLRAIAGQVKEQNAGLSREDSILLMTVVQGVLEQEEEGGDDTGAAMAAVLGAVASPDPAFPTPVTSARLRQLWSSVPANAQLIQQQTLNDQQIGQKTGIAVEQALRTVLPNRRLVAGPYDSPARNAKINEVQAVDPDGVGEMLIGQTIQRNINGVQFPPTHRVVTYRESVFIDVKILKGRAALSREKYQLLGMIDVLSRSAAKRDGFPPALVLLTPVDTIVGSSVIKEATRQGVLVYQVVLWENPTATADGQPNLIIGLPILLNPSVLRASNVSQVIPPLTTPPLQAVKFP